MKLKPFDRSVQLEMCEFDFWVTPALADIRDTERFKFEMSRIIGVLDALTVDGHLELDEARYAADLVRRTFAHLDGCHINSERGAAEDFLAALSALLFLVTGKSDNNNKCQFPIYLRNRLGWGSIPTPTSKQNQIFVVEKKIPTVLGAQDYMARIARIYTAGKQMNGDQTLLDVAARLLFEFVAFILADQPSKVQLDAYFSLFSKSRETGADATALLAPLVAFQVRGSVAASGGHEPEEILRGRMKDWGMIHGVDFNTNDVILDAEAGLMFENDTESSGESAAKAKTRAYDFVLPFRTPAWQPAIFIQAQFYAGDSGSVSHKNVDQTNSSRQAATLLSTKKGWSKNQPPIFLEYVDGAGYSTSLAGDLKKLLSFRNTAGFFQVRSAPIRLRRELQSVGFLTPLDLAHALILKPGKWALAAKHLKAEGYIASEIDRAHKVALEYGFIVKQEHGFAVVEEFMPIARRHLLLDLIASEGSDFANLVNVAGVVLVPGYGPYHGLTMADLDGVIRKHFSNVWPEGYMIDIQNLCNSGFVVLR